MIYSLGKNILNYFLTHLFGCQRGKIPSKGKKNQFWRCLRIISDIE